MGTLKISRARTPSLMSMLDATCQGRLFLRLGQGLLLACFLGGLLGCSHSGEGAGNPSAESLTDEELAAQGHLAQGPVYVPDGSFSTTILPPIPATSQVLRADWGAEAADSEVIDPWPDVEFPLVLNAAEVEQLEEVEKLEEVVESDSAPSGGDSPAGSVSSPTLLSGETPDLPIFEPSASSATDVLVAPSTADVALPAPTDPSTRPVDTFHAADDSEIAASPFQPPVHPVAEQVGTGLSPHAVQLLSSPTRPKLGLNPLRRDTRSTLAVRPLFSPATTSLLQNRPGSESRDRTEATVEPVVERPSDEPDRTEAKFDPIEANGLIFVDWPTPKLALVITGRQNGYLEPCGCAGLERMKGGLNRRHSLFEDLREKRSWPVAAVDVGSLIEGFGRQTRLKFQIAVEALGMMQYDVIALGKTDLQLPADDLIARTASIDGQSNPFVSANAALLGFDTGLTARKRIVEAGGMKLGITSIIGETWQREINNTDVEMAPPQQKLGKLVGELAGQCDLLVLLAHATTEESVQLARQFPQFDVVVTAGGPAEPPSELEKVDGSGALLVQVGEKGMNAVVLGFFDDPSDPVRYQRVPLDSRFPRSADMTHLMESYQEQLKVLGLEGLGIRSLPHPSRDLLGNFVGSKKCESCHEDSYNVWKKSGHAKAWPTLVELEPARNFDPECISCHVVGWHPQNYFPFESGFLSEAETPQLVNVGCESCHGPGEEHVKAEMGANFALQERLQNAMRVTLAESQQAVSKAIMKKQACMNCHDGENSPEFEFKSYWAKIEHREP